jgi:hypothetical protein
MYHLNLVRWNVSTKPTYRNVKFAVGDKVIYDRSMYESLVKYFMDVRILYIPELGSIITDRGNLLEILYDIYEYMQRDDRCKRSKLIFKGVIPVNLREYKVILI